jgi:hypothetical protein
MDWFERLTGFREVDYEVTRSRLEVAANRLRSKVNGASYGIGDLELVLLQELRERAMAAGSSVPCGRSRVSVVTGNVRHLHRLDENAGALFQVASQFNLLEMVSPEVTPDMGVTRYASDHTQGPAWAIAAGAATIYRNYFVPVAGGLGQTADRQLDALGDLGERLSAAIDRPVGKLWRMRNGYALCTEAGLGAIARHLDALTLDERDTLRGLLRIGLHRDVEVTEAEGAGRPRVSQAFCSALPVAYSAVAPAHWEPFAVLVLEAAYEATLWAAVLNAQRGASNLVFLTMLGGGAFGNRSGWIDRALRRALESTRTFDLDVRLVSYGTPAAELSAIAEAFR